MKSDAERRAEYEQFKKIDAAFRAGDLAALRAAVDDPASVPNGPMAFEFGPCLEYAIYHSPPEKAGLRDIAGLLAMHEARLEK